MGSPVTTWSGYAPWAATVAVCRDEFVRTARSFRLIPEAIPQPARDDVSLLYCLCRSLDDAIDEEPDPARARATLSSFRDELTGGAAPRPLIAAFLAGVPRNGVPLDCAGQLLDGMESDLGTVRVADDAELLRYAYRVSAAVGLMLSPLLGVRGAAAARHVVDLGLALQLSNILIGVSEDARRGRVYLPATRLAEAGLTPRDVLDAPDDPSLAPVRAGLAELADRFYASASAGAAHVPLRYRHGVLLLARSYAELGRRAAAGAPAPPVPSALPLGVKLRQLAGLAAVAFTPRVLGLVAPPSHDAGLHAALDPSWPGVHR